MIARRAHTLTRNKRTWTPRRVFVIDAEGRTTATPEGELDTFRLACASYTVRPGDRRKAPHTDEAAFTDPGELWRWVSARCHSDVATWMVAHGLHYDYTVTNAHHHLRARGWELVDWSVRAGSRWARWRRGRSTLILVDLFNYLGLPLAEVGKLIGVPKLTMPRQAATRRTWERYCARDVRIAREAFLRLLDWWAASDLGEFGFTAAACAMAAFRHRFLTERIRVHTDDRARRLEREALFGGRREIYRKGRLPSGTWVDLDYVAHYCVTAGAASLPVELGHLYRRGLRVDLLDHLPEGIGVIARVEVEVDRPVAPLRHPRLGIVYPVGRFVTTLCQPELELVARHGRIIRWIEAATYSLAPALEDWSDWILGMLDQPPATLDPLARVMAKDWTRSLIGKFGQRRPGPRAQANHQGEVELPELEVGEAAAVSELPWVESPPEDPLRGEDGFNAVPALTAWVHSAARAQLWEAMEAAGAEALAYTDTDGFLIDLSVANLPRLAAIAPELDGSATGPIAALPQHVTGRRRPELRDKRRATRPEVPEPTAARVPPGTMRVKAAYGGVEVHRPQDYVLDRHEVIKGLPKDRERTGPREYVATYWPGITWQMARGRPGTYLRPELEVKLRDTYDRGWVLADGRVIPLEVKRVDGRTRIVPWHRTAARKAGARLQDPEQPARVARAERSPPR